MHLPCRSWRTLSLLDKTPSMNAKIHHDKKRTYSFPSHFCMCSCIQLRNNFLHQDTRFMHLKEWTITNVLHVIFLVLIKHLIKWILWYFQSTFNSTLTSIKNSHSRCSYRLSTIAAFLVDCFLDSLDNLGDQLPVLRTITPFNIEELVEISLAIAYYFIVG